MNQRERFEAWARTQLWGDPHSMSETREYHCGWQAWQAAEAAAIERCAAEIDCACVQRVEVLAALEHGGRKPAQRECTNGATCCAIMAADLRLMKED